MEMMDKMDIHQFVGTDYWTSADIAYMEQYCANYIDQNINQAIGGEY